MSRATLFCGLILLMTSLGPINAQEGYALISIMQKWKVDLLNWAPGTDHCSWPKVKCDGQKNVIFLDLSGVGLSGPVPEEVGTLTSLEYLDLSNNQIRGELSPLGGLTNLQVLNVSLNALGGGFPYAVFKLTKLIDLRVDNLYLSGPFPKGWTALKNLEYLYIGNNTMTGPLPSELAKLSNLKELTLWNNPINSALPSELGSLSKLTYLNVHHCSMWGPLPPEFSQLQNMERLHLYDNYFTGRVPDSWKNMTNLKDLRLQYNYLTGSEFPAWIPNHPKLTRVRLECCFYKGPTPIQPPLIDQFFYYGNCFDGQVIDYGPRNCSRDTTCDGFFRILDQYGCPPCPREQIPLNVSACVCGLESKTSSSWNDNIKIFFPTAIGFILVLLIAISMFIQSRRSRKRRQFKTLLASKTGDGDWDVPAGVQRFRIEDIARSTRNFHVSNQIGAGGFGKVFVGTLESGKKLAIKCSSMASLQGSTEFRNEVVLLSRLHHCNLVHLEGFCEDDGLRILVYEFMENGNLHTWLSAKNGIRHILGWHKRLEISLDIAHGLDYLHSFADPPVIHRDIKPSNILLDANLIAKLCDFGLSKATPEFETHLSTIPAGTAGYIDPQYFLRQHLTTASDVYGFGVVLLELITGQKSIDESRIEESNLVEWVKLMITAGGIRGVVDPFLGSDYPEKIYEKFIELAVKCASFESRIRPTMKEIVGILEYLLQTSPPETQVSTSEMDRGTISAHTSDPASESERNAYFQLTPR